MFDIGWAELLIIGLVALIVVGPEDLPKMFRKLGQYVGKMRNMAREFQNAMNDAADQAGVKDIKDDLTSATNMTDKIFGDASESLKNYQTKMNQAADPLAEHAKRVKQVEDANKNAEAFSKAYTAAQEDAAKAQDIDEETPPQQAIETSEKKEKNQKPKTSKTKVSTKKTAKPKAKSKEKE